jgi:nitroreductase
MNSIFKRGSSRNYTGEAISASDIEMLLRAGMAAPTAMNTQPWEFVVVQDKDKLNEIMKVHPYSQMLKDAGAAIIVCADTTKGMPELQAQKFWIQDCSAATENILIEATELNLGTVWLGTYPKQELCNQISKIFGLPENIMPVTIISIGHPSSQVHPKDKFDKKKIHFNKW